MNCPQCLQQVEVPSAFCPYCGVRLEKDGWAAAVSSEDPTFAALAHANLLRLRGDWDGAREKTVSVLREFPNSGTAHSVMGDICADQEMYEEAAQWYRMALDLEPDNGADARKLEHAEALLRERQAGAEEAEDQPRRIAPLMVLGWASAAFLAVVIAVGLWMNAQRPRPEYLGPAPYVPPVYDAEPPGPPVPSPEPPVQRSAPERPAAEAAVRASLRSLESQLAALGTTWSFTWVDPRRLTAVVTLDGGRIDPRAPDGMEHAHGAALLAARTVLEQNPDIRGVTVSVEMPLWDVPAAGREIIFVGEVLRKAGETLEFDTRWWRQGIDPPPAIAATGAAP